MYRKKETRGFPLTNNTQRGNKQHPRGSSHGAESSREEINSNGRNQERRRNQGFPQQPKNSSFSNSKFHCDDRSIARKYGYKRLEEFANKEQENEIVIYICNNFVEFNELLRSKPRWDILLLLLKVVKKILNTDFTTNKIKILSSICNDEFCEHLNATALKTLGEEIFKNTEEFFDCLLVIFEQIFNLLPVSAERFGSLINFTCLFLKEKEDFKIIYEKALSLKDNLNIISKKSEQKEKNPQAIDKMSQRQPPNDYRSISLFPTKEDFESKNFLRPNIVVGSYENAYHYLDIQFRLLREDFIQPLRMGLETYRENLEKPKGKRVKNHHVRIYNNVQFKKLDVDLKRNSKGITYQVALDDKFYKKINWAHSKRLLYGSLLLFSRDEFSSFIVATVSDKSVDELSKNGVFKVTFKDEQIKTNIKFDFPYSLMESSAFYEPYFNVLSTLQNLSIETIPMEKYFLVQDNTPSMPNYMKGRMLKIGNFADKNSLYSVSAENPVQWPGAEDLFLNDSQYEALCAALQNEFVVVQGPPGTGKTFLGLKIVKTLLANYDNLNLNCPIVIVCYTNHALDQFLENLLDSTREIIRVGGQSKNENLTRFNLNIVRKSGFSKSFYEARDELLNFLNIIQDTSHLIEVLKDDNIKEGILNIPFYLKHNSLKQLFQLDTDFEYWLLEEFFINQKIQYHDYQHYASLCGGSTLESDLTEYDLYDSDDENYRRLADEEDSMFKDIKSKYSKIHYIVDFPTLKKIKNRLLIELENPDLKKKDSLIIEEMLFGFNELDKYLQYLSLNTQKSNLNIANLLDRNPWSLNYSDRWKIYFYLKKCLSSHLKDNMTLCLAKYSHLMQNFEEEKCKIDYNFLKTSMPKILGLTTSCAAKNHTLLELLKPKIVVVEEAAEVLEAHVTISLTRHCEHLILIGDHEQLRPNPSCINLAKKFKLDVSLFERMLMNGMNCYQLNVQHRMREEIVSLITPCIYKDLKSFPSVLSYPHIKGVTKNLFFINHNVFESEDADCESHKNPHEGDFAMSLCRYLLLQGYSPDEITVLTTYSAQQFYLRDLKRKNEIFRNVRVTVVDNYQGEENNIIILSLVRSNQENNVGFLKTRNRICVALSRAKHGLFIIGNMSNLCEASDIWKEVNNTLLNINAVGESLELKCEVHKTLTLVKNASDFSNVPEGGCLLKCARLMPCGHHCLSICHIADLEHTQFSCAQPCQRQICTEGHPCPKKCFEKCDNCLVKVTKHLPCGHTAENFCYKKPENITCLTVLSDTKPDCLHPVDRFCYLTIDKVICPVPCNTRLDCGHACAKKCHVNNDPEHEEYKCLKDCPFDNKSCQENHKCQKRCYEECGLCIVKVKRQLPCDHIIDMNCSNKVEDVKCPRGCKRLLSCGHPCKRICSDPCGGCKERVSKTFEICGHTIKNVICGEPLKSSLCKSPCERILNCGHKCPLRCGANCSGVNCKVLVPCPVKQACGHEASVPCYKAKSFTDGRSDSLLKYCQKPCSTTLPCGDLCKGTCGSCMQGRIHQACNSPCKNTLVCGHECQVPCRENCPPCQMNCRYKCKHSVCKKLCGVPCVPCKERCEWKCDHLKCTRRCGDICNRKPCYEPCPKKLKCGHMCVGFCGEPCPKLCRDCNFEELTELFFGDEEEPNSRFVLLNDCKHILESTGLETWIGIETDDGKPKEIKLKCCPKCKTPILTTLRFMNQTKATFQQIEAVKKKIFNSSPKNGELISKLKPKVQEVMKLLKEIPSIESENHDIRKLVNKILNIPNPRSKRKISGSELKLLHFICLYLEMILKDFKQISLKINSYNYDIIKSRLYLLIFHLSKREFKIGESEIHQFNMESLRFHRMIELSIIITKASAPNIESAKVNIQKVENELFSINLFNKDQDTRMDQELKTLVERMKSFYQPVTQKERNEIHQAMSQYFTSHNKLGHWFKCSNGHIYTITECGGAMQKGVCPECKEIIGGASHSLVSTSRLASEMDGARHAAWSDAQNMQNFRFF